MSEEIISSELVPVRDTLEGLRNFSCVDSGADIPVLDVVLDLSCKALEEDPDRFDPHPDVIAGLLGEDAARRAVWGWIQGAHSRDQGADRRIKILRSSLHRLRKFYEDEEFERDDEPKA